MKNLENFILAGIGSTQPTKKEKTYETVAGIKRQFF